MKVTVTANGEVVLDITNGDGQAALDLIHALQEDARRKEVSASRQEASRAAATMVPISGTKELNEIQYRTWSYLCDNDVAGGVHVSQVAHAFGINNMAANSRLLTLHKAGYAERTAKGYYRALTPSDSEDD